MTEADRQRDWGSTVARAHMIDKVEQAGFPRDIAVKTLEPGYRDDIRRWVRCIRENRARRQQLEGLV